MILPSLTRIKILSAESSVVYACRNALRSVGFLPHSKWASLNRAISILSRPFSFPLQEVSDELERIGQLLYGAETATEFDVLSTIDYALLSTFSFASTDEANAILEAYNGSVSLMMSAKRLYGREGTDGTVNNAIRDLVKLELDHDSSIYVDAQVATTRLWEQWQPNGWEENEQSLLALQPVQKPVSITTTVSA